MPHTAIPTRDIFDAGGRGIRHENLRRTNEKAVLTIIGFNAGVSNAEISRLSGLAPQTVSAILNDLEANELVVRGPVLRGRRGQPATPLELNKDGAYGIGVDLGWRHICVGSINFHGEVLGSRVTEFAYPDATTVADTIAGMVAELVAELPVDRRSRLLDIGVAMPKDFIADLDLNGAPAEQISLWQKLDLKAELAARTGLEVMLLDDGNSGCWAELIALPRPRPENILYFLCTDHVAAGVVSGGSLLEGLSGHGADLGAMLVRLDDSILEVHEVASIAALGRSLLAAGKIHDFTTWETWADPSPERDIWIGRAAKALARSVYNAMMLIESPLVIVDTVLGSDVNALICERLRVELTELPVRNFDPPDVVPGTFGRTAPTVGAAELPLFRRYF